VQFFALCTLMNPLMGRVEASRVFHHADQSGLLLQCGYRFGICPAVRKGDFDLHVLAGVQALNSLCRMQLRGRAENGCLDSWLC